MEKHFKKADLDSIIENPFQLIGDDWMLITAGQTDNFNTMTASWGTIGILWHKPVAICYIRPQRYTFEFVEKNEYFTLSFFTDEFRDILMTCGTKSGREIDKVNTTGLIPLNTELGNIYFSQARLVLECKKIYYDDIKPQNFISPEIHDNYPTRDYHRMFVGEIINCMVEVK